MLYPYGDYFAVNVSSPNTPGLRTLQDRGHLAELLSACAQPYRRIPKPILVKIAPDLTEPAIADLLAGLPGARGGRRDRHQHDARPGRRSRRDDVVRREQAGGLERRARWPSGPGTWWRSCTARHRGSSRSSASAEFSTADDAAALFDAGASLVQLYTGLIYRGPSPDP